MKEILFVRHAKSSWENPFLRDFERPLSLRGREDVPVMARRILRHEFIPEAIFSSGAKRARKTSKIIAEVLGLDPEIVKVEDGLYAADSHSIVEYIKKIDPRLQRVMMVGHNPGYTDVVNFLSRAKLDNLPTCGLALIRFETQNWDLSGQKGDLIFLEYPRLFK